MADPKEHFPMRPHVPPHRPHCSHHTVGEPPWFRAVHVPPHLLTSTLLHAMLRTPGSKTVAHPSVRGPAADRLAPIARVAETSHPSVASFRTGSSPPTWSPCLPANATGRGVDPGTLQIRAPGFLLADLDAVRARVLVCATAARQACPLTVQADMSRERCRAPLDPSGLPVLFAAMTYIWVQMHLSFTGARSFLLLTRPNPARAAARSPSADQAKFTAIAG
ncbi:hypothetical protein B0H66DRAFT_629322 [Apodospora peruviana]|uniref:Uncharacterized protein n=1 Tax=Apodospora peruviana TaxID=516989 RepID=A0AAE0M0B4_9PEZI|nr:hypothetical protein B0H66DRAFT_629322 [Apodospora peruviana]